jgi:hypothetical protein
VVVNNYIKYQQTEQSPLTPNNLSPLTSNHLSPQITSHLKTHLTPNNLSPQTTSHIKPPLISNHLSPQTTSHLSPQTNKAKMIHRTKTSKQQKIRYVNTTLLLNIFFADI